MKTLSFALILLTAPYAIATAAAQNPLEEAKAQYAAAAYDDALSTLTRVDVGPAGNRVELEQYRAFCLIALGRTSDAERAVAALVAADPKYVPSTTVASPRVLSLFGDMRKKELPTVARRLMEEGRLAFKEKDVARARQRFELLLQLLDDPALKSRPEAADLRLLADGFFALTNAPATAAATKPDLPAAPAPAPSSAAASVFRPAVAIQQTLPLWQPPDAMSRARDYSGAIKVLIGIDGRVKSATIERPTHPSYDSRLRQASRQWLYQPATQNGEAVESELVIRIELRKTTSTPTK